MPHFVYVCVLHKKKISFFIPKTHLLPQPSLKKQSVNMEKLNLERNVSFSFLLKQVVSQNPALM